MQSKREPKSEIISVNTKFKVIKKDSKPAKCLVGKAFLRNSLKTSVPESSFL